jgi:hypothetical protein|nr:hypothetical protein [Butyrivibrio sp.]
MSISKKSKLTLVVLGLIVLTITGLFMGYRAIKNANGYDDKDLDDSKTGIELYVLAPCESCNEEEKFTQEVFDKLLKQGTTDYKCTVYNVYQESGASHFENTINNNGLSISIHDLPAAIVNGEVYLGTYEEIGEEVAKTLQSGGGIEKDRSSYKDKVIEPYAGSSVQDTEHLFENESETAIYKDLSSIEDDDTVLILFVTTSCEGCTQAEKYLQSDLAFDKQKLLIYNIMEGDNTAVLRKIMKLYEVPDNLQQVPILFFKTGYLSGADAIRKDTHNYLADAGSAGSWDEVVSKLSTEKEDVRISKLKLIVTGFINGLNPCGLSMLIMVLSVLLMSGRSFSKGSISYLAGKFITYLELGLSIGTLLDFIEGRVFGTVYTAVNIVFAVVATCFGLFYLADFVHVCRHDYGKEKLRLPEGFRRWNHNMIKKLSNAKGWLLYPMLFALGIVISAGEFLCTGQVYLATLIYMAGHKGVYGTGLTGDLVIYLIAMCIPMLLLVIFVSKGQNIMSASHLSLKILPFIKLSYSVFFFVLAFSLLL